MRRKRVREKIEKALDIKVMTDNNCQSFIEKDFRGTFGISIGLFMPSSFYAQHMTMTKSSARNNKIKYANNAAASSSSRFFYCK